VRAQPVDFSFLYEWARSLAHIFLDPFLQLCLLFLLAFVSAVFAPRKRYRFFALAFATFYFLIMTTPFMPNLLIGILQSQYPVVVEKDPKQAIVVLTGGIALYESSSRQFSWGGAFDRGGEAIRLMKKNFGQYLIVSGGSPYDHHGFEDEGTSIKRLAKELGVPEEKVIVENESRNTFEHPQKLKAVFEKHGIKDFYLVTSATHMLRAMMVFEAQGFRPTAYPVGLIPLNEKWGFGLQYLGRAHDAFYEMFGLLGYWYTQKL
jgi:uncharacterized SAM-binding protein YcdF (DUF218 family)